MHECAAYEYNDQGRRTKMTRGNGAVTNYGYDLAARLISFENDMDSTADDVTLTFTHAPSGQIASRATSNSAYDWDGAGPVSQTYGINGLNQMISAALGSISHDDRGNTTDVGSKDYTYDIYNNLTSAVDTGAGINASMDYDPAGRLASVTGNGTVTKFGYSGTQMIAEYNASGTILKRYVHGAGVDAPIVMYEGTGLSTRKWLMTDQQGSVTAHTNHSGAVTAKNTYNEYGVPDAANTGRFQYTGQMWLAEAKVYHYKARAYDPYLARFLQTDPIGYAAGMNMYAYVNGDPVNLSDPSGLSPNAGRYAYNCDVYGTYQHGFGWVPGSFSVQCSPYAVGGTNGGGSAVGRSGGRSGHLGGPRRVRPQSNADEDNNLEPCLDDPDPIDHWPVPGFGDINPENLDVGQGNGYYGFTRGGGTIFHGGIDITVPVGTSIVAASAGRIVATGSNPSSGNWIEIWGASSGDTYQTRYWHLNEILVEQSQRVAAGEVIATSGASGNVPFGAAPHLHFETVINNETRVDPLSVVSPSCR